MDEEEVKIKQEIYSGSTAVPELPPKVVRIFVSSTFVGRFQLKTLLLKNVLFYFEVSISRLREEPRTAHALMQSNSFVACFSFIELEKISRNLQSEKFRNSAPNRGFEDGHVVNIREYHHRGWWIMETRGIKKITEEKRNLVPSMAEPSAGARVEAQLVSPHTQPRDTGERPGRESQTPQPATKVAKQTTSSITSGKAPKGKG